LCDLAMKGASWVCDGARDTAEAGGDATADACRAATSIAGKTL